MAGFLLRSKARAKSLLRKDNHTTSTNKDKTLLRGVSLGSGIMPSSGIITPPLTPFDNDDDDNFIRIDEQQNSGYFNKKQQTESSARLSNKSVLIRVCGDTSRDMRMPDDFSDSAAYPIGVPFEFESELFKGKVLLRAKGLADSEDPRGDEYFSGRYRTYQHVIQGRFKEEIPVSEFQSGYEFYQPLKRLPCKAGLQICIAVAKKLAPSIEICLNHDKESTILGTPAAFKKVRADKPGEEVDITDHNIEEDCTLLGGVFAKGKVSARRRQKILSDPAKLKDYKFDTENIFTIEFYEFIADLNNWTLPLGFTTINLEPILGKQPLTWVGKTGDRYIWSGGIIHKKLLLEDEEV